MISVNPLQPLRHLPPGATDCHTHVFLDAAQFTWSSTRRYTPPPASVEALVALHDSLGIERVVIVQPSVYGDDNAATLQALRQLGPNRARGVAVINADTTDETLEQMAAAGVRGVRVNLEIDAEHDAAKASGWMQRIASRVAPLGWHMQVFANLPLLGACSEILAGLAVPLVFDHYAGAQAGLGEAQPGLPEVLKLVESGKAYVKLSAPYRCAAPGALETLEPLTRLLMERNPERMLWGSDWPHPQPGVRATPSEICPPFDVQLGQVLDAMCAWAPTADSLQRMFVDNPERIYGFGR